MSMTKTMKRILISLCAVLFCVALGFFFSVGTLLTAKAEKSNLKDMYCDGAGIRLVDEVDDKGNNTSGIRFSVRVNTTKEDGEIKVLLNGEAYSQADFAKMEKGILLIPADKLSETEELTLYGAENQYKSGAKAANKKPAWKLSEDGSYYEAMAYIYNITEDTFGRDFIYRGYYKIGDVVHYTDITEESTRSVSYVALQAKKDTSNTFTDGQLKILNNFLPETFGMVQTKFSNRDAYLYRLGNANVVSVKDLFDFSALTPYGLKYTDLGTDSVKVEAKNGHGVSCEVTDNYELKFTGTGVVSISLNLGGVDVSEAMLFEVIDAKNITKAESATANDVVLLNDISGTFVVSNGHTFHGNGFTVKLPTTHVKNKGQGFTGYISIGAAQDDGIANGGNLDNVRIEGPVYPEMYIYRNQAEITSSSDPDYGDGYNMRYFVNSVIVYGGNCTISNCYISGSRAALCLRGGNNVVIEDTTLSGGSYANMEICAGSKVTLRNLTTVQTDVTDSYGKGKTAHGLGIAVDSSVVDLYIEGELKQYNWLNQTKWNSIIPSAYQSQFPKFFTNNTFSKYWHYLNGGSDPYVDLGIVFKCNWDTSRIHDNRTTVDYATQGASIADVQGGIYSKVNTVGGNAISDADFDEPEYQSKGFNPIAPTLDFSIDNNDETKDDPNIKNDFFCVYDEDNRTLNIGLGPDEMNDKDNPGGYVLNLAQCMAIKHGEVIEGLEVYLNGEQASLSAVKLALSNGSKQYLTFKVTVNNAGYDKDGKPIEGSMEYTWTIPVALADVSKPEPEWNMGGDYQFSARYDGCVYAYYGTSNGYGEAVPIYEGIKINYYDKTGKLVNLDLSGTTTHPTGSNNSNSNAFTYKLSDGSTLTMKFSSGWKSGATTHQFTTYKNKVYIYPQSLDNDNYIRAKISNQAFDVKISYTFTDPNGQSISQTMQWYSSTSENSKVATEQWQTFDSKNGKKPSTCIAEGTMITLADGTQKAVEDLQVGDMIMVFNHYTGKYDARPLVINVHADEEARWHRIVNIQFSNGALWRIAWAHGIYDCTLNEYVMISEENIDEFIGHEFYYTDGVNGQKVTMTGYYFTEEFIKVYSPAPAEFINYFANGLLNGAPLPDTDTAGQLNYFEFDENMMYDEAQMQADIEKYGLYTYEDFADYIPEELFYALPFQYVKISVAKGLMTWEEIIHLIEFVFKA